MSFEHSYSKTDRLLHRLAFRSGGLQVALADIEKQIYKSRLANITVDRPVFVTGLPRAGTTILLNLLVGTGQFAAHTYRDMPFLLCPMLWQGLTGRFQVSSEQRERAHGDGIMVGEDSPEAFEEMLWKQFWPEHYEDGRIDPWVQCQDPEFLEFFTDHMIKIIALRSPTSGRPRRYLSKNNGNIGRLACLPDVLPDGKFLVPYREPLQHASSLLKQHKAFLTMHRTDEFARTYMAGIGHFDFGANLRPINFDNWLDGQRSTDTLSLTFWLQYWCAAYGRIIDQLRANVQLLSYAALVDRAFDGLSWVAAFLDLDDPHVLSEQADQLRAPRMHPVDSADVDDAVLDEAQSLYERLERRSAF